MLFWQKWCGWLVREILLGCATSGLNKHCVSLSLSLSPSLFLLNVLNLKSFFALLILPFSHCKIQQAKNLIYGNSSTILVISIICDKMIFKNMNFGGYIISFFYGCCVIFILMIFLFCLIYEYSTLT